MSQQAELELNPTPAAAPALSGKSRGETLAAFDRMQLRKQRSLWNNAWRQFRQHKLAMTGLVIIVCLVLAVLIGPLIYGKEIDEIDFTVTSDTFSRAHPLGTDSLGQDILARILWGGRISLAVGITAAFIGIAIGTVVGALSGFFGGFTDSFLMRFTDLFISLPTVPLLLLITFLFRDSLVQTFDERFNNGNLGIFVLIVTVVSILSWMPTARIVRASFLSLKEKEFVEAARSIGADQNALMFKHMMPNVLSPIIVAATLAVGAAIIAESTLSFLGLGFPSDMPTWGRMLYDAKDWIQFSPHEALVPGMAIFLTVLSINYIGDGLRDALDPRKTR